MLLTNFQFILFGEYKDYDADQERVMNIFKKFVENDMNVLPGTFQQLNPNFGLKPSDRIVFNNTKENFNIQIGLDAIQIQKNNPKLRAYNFIDELNNFIRLVKKTLKSLFELEEKFKLGTRISIIIENTYEREELGDLKQIFEKITVNAPGYNSEETFEWSFRFVKRNEINKEKISNEKINLVNEISRINGNLNSNGEVNEIDTIQVKHDINTLFDVNSERIDLLFADEFLNESKQIILSQKEELEVILFEK
ncbi:hypothetical protein RSA11_11965 [Exiguobacterium indicum]|uniref:Uncharacterized protein n=1 Tax=Exiguobacterium indicum TaxID=296995 RepID=A0AAW3MB99_9BACL|nr:hypothetical protein [Exiguobacterium indicum]KTR26104.1 hypothetical protein RSA11_11965 [Exiguobacterium indicum]